MASKVYCTAMVVYKCIAVFVLCLQGIHGLCPDDFEHLGNSCYHAFFLEASWIEAKLYCRALGTDLVRIDSQEEETLIEGIMSRSAALTTHMEYWTAGADIINEGQWRWMTADGVSYPMAAYTNWGQGQPSTVLNQDDCMLVHYHHGSRQTYWADDVCSGHHSFVCEGRFMYD